MRHLKRDEAFLVCVGFLFMCPNNVSCTIATNVREAMVDSPLPSWSTAEHPVGWDIKKTDANGVGAKNPNTIPKKQPRGLSINPTSQKNGGNHDVKKLQHDGDRYDVDHQISSLWSRGNSQRHIQALCYKTSAVPDCSSNDTAHTSLSTVKCHRHVTQLPSVSCPQGFVYDATSAHCLRRRIGVPSSENDGHLECIHGRQLDEKDCEIEATVDPHITTECEPGTIALSARRCGVPCHSATPNTLSRRQLRDTSRVNARRGGRQEELVSSYGGGGAGMPQTNFGEPSVAQLDPEEARVIEEILAHFTALEQKRSVASEATDAIGDGDSGNVPAEYRFPTLIESSRDLEGDDGVTRHSGRRTKESRRRGREKSSMRQARHKGRDSPTRELGADGQHDALQRRRLDAFLPSTKPGWSSPDGRVSSVSVELPVFDRTVALLQGVSSLCSVVPPKHYRLTCPEGYTLRSSETFQQCFKILRVPAAPVARGCSTKVSFQQTSSSKYVGPLKREANVQPTREKTTLHIESNDGLVNEERISVPQGAPKRIMRRSLLPLPDDCDPFERTPAVLTCPEGYVVGPSHYDTRESNSG